MQSKRLLKYMKKQDIVGGRLNMAQGQFLRNLIIETPSKPGNLGKVTMAIGQLNGDIGDIQTLYSPHSKHSRAITPVQMKHLYPASHE